MDLNEINEKQDGLFIFVAIVGIVLFVALLVHAFDKHKKKDSVGMLIALFFAFLALLIAIGSNYAIDDPSKRLVKFNLSFNSDEFKEAVVCYWKYAGVVVIFAAFYFIGRLFTIDRDTAAGINLREEMERYLIGIAHPEFTLVERSSVDDRSLGYLRSTFSMKQEDSINLLSNRI